MDKNENFCILPWLQLEIMPDGAIKTCCEQKSAYSNNPNDDLRSIFNSKPANEIRRAFKNGEVPANCRECIERSKISTTYKTSVSPQWEQHTLAALNATNEDGSTDFPIKFLDLRFSNLCNFTCRTCESYSSNRWSELDKQLNRYSHPLSTWDTNSLALENIYKILPEVEQIYFAGGEPLIIEGHYKVLNWLIDNKRTDVKLLYNTNLSISSYKGVDIRQYWDKFDLVSLQISLDSIEEKGEYIREGLNWNRFQKNYNHLNGYISGSNTVVSVYNIFSVLEVVKWLHCEKNIIVYLYPLFHPEEMSMTILPLELKEKVAEKIFAFIKENDVHPQQKEELELNVNYMMSRDDSHLSSTFKKNNDIIDRYHQKEFCSTFPELSEWYKKI